MTSNSVLSPPTFPAMIQLPDYTLKILLSNGSSRRFLLTCFLLFLVTLMPPLTLHSPLQTNLNFFNFSPITICITLLLILHHLYPPGKAPDTAVKLTLSGATILLLHT